MTKPEILEKTPLALGELKGVLKEMKKRDEELGFRAKKTDEYLTPIPTLTAKQAIDLKKELIALDIPRLKPEHIVKIIDLLPSTVPELKLIIQGYSLTVSNENLSKIVDTVKELAGSAKK